jgi:hypothetical protein
MGGLQQIARELGVTESQAKKGAAALAPAILGGLKKQAQSSGSGAEGLGELLSTLDLDGDGNPLDDILRTLGKLTR